MGQVLPLEVKPMKENEKATKSDEPVQAEKLEDKIALAMFNPKKGPEPPPYPPGSLYGLISRHNLS